MTSILTSILILCSHLRLDIPEGLFPVGLGLNIIKIKYVAYSSRENHTRQLDFRNCLADGSTTEYRTNDL